MAILIDALRPEVEKYITGSGKHFQIMYYWYNADVDAGVSRSASITIIPAQNKIVTYIQTGRINENEEIEQFYEDTYDELPYVVHYFLMQMSDTCKPSIKERVQAMLKISEDILK